MGCPCASGPPSSSCLGAARSDLLAFLFQAHVGRSTQQRRGGGFCSRSASTRQGSASSGSFTPRRDRVMVCLVSTLRGRFLAWCVLGSGSVAGKALAQQPRSEPQSPSLAERTLTCDLRVSVLFPPFCASLLTGDLVFCTLEPIYKSFPVPLILTAKARSSSLSSLVSSHPLGSF